MSRVLVLACSRTKRRHPEPLPAVDRYDGPAFRVLRRYLRQRVDPELRVAILSAEFGLIDGSTMIGDYDRRMDRRRAEELASKVKSNLVSICSCPDVQNLMICASGVYLAALEEGLAQMPPALCIERTERSIGGQMSMLTRWLRSFDAPVSTSPAKSGRVVVRGVELCATPGEIARRARQALAADRPGAQRFESWCVEVAGHVVAPKWLLSLLTGLPVATFRTADAVAALGRLGVMARHASPLITRAHVRGQSDMLVVACLSIKNLEPRVWDRKSKYYLPGLRAVMVSYAEFHQMAARRKRAMDVGLHEFLGVPRRVKVYLDNGAFYFLRQKGEAERKNYKEFVKRAKPDWYPIPFDAIPTPQMCDDGQRECFKRTMQYNYWYQHDGYVPVIHISRHLSDYIERMKANVKLNAKQHIALGGIVPNLLRTPKALAYSDIIETLEQVRTDFQGKKLHVFGIGGTSTLHLGALLGMDSVDSSGWRNRAARGIVQMPGSGDRAVSDLGSWRGRIPTEREWAILRKCPCPACTLYGLEGLRTNGLAGFCNRATHNLHVLLDEADWVDQRLRAGTYKRTYKRRLDNSVYLPIIERLVSDLF